ncbi:hypothetical protein NP493_13g06016 [Ridgeia piscesae]|uniref:Uncharacterized protein n=1 Tax=Ridgeia piscesae TaxID=27915 RepID=A0AAD9PEM0_RIDPI|nr:hypothetical protein NP493_13g06016 [Ridgeia piscesae]
MIVNNTSMLLQTLLASLCHDCVDCSIYTYIITELRDFFEVWRRHGTGFKLHLYLVHRHRDIGHCPSMNVQLAVSFVCVAWLGVWECMYASLRYLSALVIRNGWSLAKN